MEVIQTPNIQLIMKLFPFTFWLKLKKLHITDQKLHHIGINSILDCLFYSLNIFLASIDFVRIFLQNLLGRFMRFSVFIFSKFNRLTARSIRGIIDWNWNFVARNGLIFVKKYIFELLKNQKLSKNCTKFQIFKRFSLFYKITSVQL